MCILKAYWTTSFKLQKKKNDTIQAGFETRHGSTCICRKLCETYPFITSSIYDEKLIL